MTLPDWAIDPDEKVAGTPETPAPAFEDHRVCTAECFHNAVPSPLIRERPPAVNCDWCGAPPGVACTWRGHPLARPHPCRIQGAA